ncbi:MAG: phosphate ABC transporter permease subunit PstC, partial [Acidimicrobiales bacterium]|nr:phosphate ABC transporter permease subunit PstC [Acidimicrobiales bacterium]
MTALTIDDLQGDRRRARKERFVSRLFTVAAAFSIVVSILIVVSLFREAFLYLTGIRLDWPVFVRGDLPFVGFRPEFWTQTGNGVVIADLWTTGWFPRRGLFDVKTLLVASVGTTTVAMLLAVPVGIGTAVYLSEYASPRVRRIVKPVIEVLAGIPSVVLGFFALAWIAPNVVDRVFDPTSSANLLVAGLGVGILTIPLVASISEDALRSVPHALREAAYGVGAKKVQTVVRVVVPSALSGLVAAFIVAVSRAIGETLVVTIAAGGSGGALFPEAFPSPEILTESGLTMTAAMATVAAGSDQVVGQGPTFQSLFFVGLLLFLLTFLLNFAADRIVRRFRQ